MNLSPLLDAPLAVQIHVATVLPAAVLGPIVFLRRKGTPLHRLLGRFWVGLMVVSALSSLFIHSINMFHGFSPIHLISVYVIFGAVFAVRSARAGQIAAHRRQVVGLYLGGIVGAGAFTLLPGRIMNAVLLPGLTGQSLFDARFSAPLALVFAFFAFAIAAVLRGRIGRI
jgi:uncharacterized membrane protein